MDLNLMKEKWLEQDRNLDLAIQLNRQLLVASKLNRVRSPLRRFAWWLGLEALLAFAGLLLLGSFIHAHFHEPRFWLPAVSLNLWIIATLGASVRQILLANQIDYDEPIAVIQKQLASLQLLAIRTNRWALLTGQLLWWIPFVIVAFKGLLDVDAYQAFGATMLLVNLAFSLALIPLALWLTPGFGDHLPPSRATDWLIRALSGDHLNAATDYLNTLSHFEKDPPLKINQPVQDGNPGS